MRHGVNGGPGAPGEPDSVVNGPAIQSLHGYARLNLVTTVAGFMISVAVGLWFTPFLVHSLGPAAYGLIPLATTVVSYFSLLSQTLSSALTRTISMALATGDAARANRAFGSALGGALVLAAIMALPLAALSWWSSALFEFPRGARDATRILFAIVAATFVIALISTPYQTVSFSRNRVYLINLAALAQTGIRVGGTILFFTITASIVNAALAILLSAVAALVLNFAFARISAPMIRATSIAVDGAELRAMSKTSSHVLLMQIGMVMTMSCELVIVNRLFGSHEAGRYAAVMQWLLLLRNATTALVVLCVPTILALAAERRSGALVDYTKRAMTWIAIGIALPTGYLCGLSPRILSVWLGPDFAGLWPVMVIQLVPLAITAAAVPLYSITLAADRMFLAGLVQIGVAIVGIVLGVALGSMGGPVWVAAAVGWSFALKEILFAPAYAARNIGLPWYIFLGPILLAVGLFAFAAALSWGAGESLHPGSILTLGLTGIMVSIVYLGCLALFARPVVTGALRALRGTEPM